MQQFQTIHQKRKITSEGPQSKSCQICSDDSNNNSFSVKQFWTSSPHMQQFQTFHQKRNVTSEGPQSKSCQICSDDSNDNSF